MAFDKVASLPGMTKQYRLSPNVKKYTLRDSGFQETKSGNYQYVRSLADVGSKQGAMLKVLVDKEIETLRISTTTANGLKSLNVFNTKMEANVKNLTYILDWFVEKNVLEEV